MLWSGLPKWQPHHTYNWGTHKTLLYEPSAKRKTKGLFIPQHGLIHLRLRTRPVSEVWHNHYIIAQNAPSVCNTTILQLLRSGSQMISGVIQAELSPTLDQSRAWLTFVLGRPRVNTRTCTQPWKFLDRTWIRSLMSSSLQMHHLSATLQDHSSVLQSVDDLQCYASWAQPYPE